MTGELHEVARLLDEVKERTDMIEAWLRELPADELATVWEISVRLAGKECSPYREAGAIIAKAIDALDRDEDVSVPLEKPRLRRARVALAELLREP